MVNENYLLVAKSLVDRNENRLNTELSPREHEIDDLFFWLISRLEWSIRGCWPAQKSHIVKVTEDYCYDDNRVLLKHGRVSDYLSTYVSRNEFYYVMQEVADIFNKINEQLESDYFFYADCSTTFWHAELTVQVTKGKNFSSNN